MCVRGINEYERRVGQKMRASKTHEIYVGCEANEKDGEKNQDHENDRLQRQPKRKSYMVDLKK